MPREISPATARFVDAHGTRRFLNAHALEVMELHGLTAFRGATRPVQPRGESPVPAAKLARSARSGRPPAIAPGGRRSRRARRRATALVRCGELGLKRAITSDSSEAMASLK